MSGTREARRKRQAEFRASALDCAARAQRYLERAARLEGSGQPKVCADYVRRAGELIDEGREQMAWARGGWKPFKLAIERLGFLEPASTRNDFALAGPSKGSGS